MKFKITIEKPVVSSQEGQSQILQVVRTEALFAQPALELLLARGGQRALFRRALVGEDVEVALAHL